MIHIRSVWRHLAAAFVALVLALTTVVVVTGGPASATGNKPCYPTVQHNDTKPYVNLGADGNTATTGTFELLKSGVRIKTPDATSKVYGYHPLPLAPHLADVTGGSFSNTKLGAAATVEPSYQFGLDADGDGDWDATLAWESLYQPGWAPINPGLSLFDVIKGGAAAWYVTKDVPAVPAGPVVLTKQTVKTWTEIHTLLPSARLLYFGINQGAGNAGADNVVDAVQLVYKASDNIPAGCLLHQWRQRPPSKTSHSPSASVSASPSSTASAVPSSPAVVVPVGNTSGSLPVTGPSRTPLLFTVGLFLVAIGAALLIVLRRRPTRFVDPDPVGPVA